MNLIQPIRRLLLAVTALLALSSICRAQSSNADLFNLQVSAGSLSPVFDSATTAYSASVAYGINSVTVTPTAADGLATITINGDPIASGNASSPIALTVGANAISIVVTAENGFTTRTYSLTVTRETPNVDLSSLVPSAGTLTPVFASATVNYTASVSYETPGITVTPTAAAPLATITVNGNPVTSGSASETLNLNVGQNVISIVVTGEDAVTTKTYTLTVTRETPNVDLSALTISAGTLTPVFASATVNYTASVSYETPGITVTPTAAAPLATITVNGNPVTSGSASETLNLSVGQNVISIVVTGEDAVTTKTYTLTVTRSTPNVDLSALTISAGTLRPVFASATVNYTAGVPYTTTSLTVTPTAAAALATITVNGTPVTSGSASGAINLSVGPNVISIVVTGEDAVTTKTYTLTVKRAVSPYAPNIYEPFADSNASLTGNTPGTGLGGTWTATSSFTVGSGSLTSGMLPTSGNHVDFSTGNSNAAVATNSDLADAGLLNYGSSLWFSLIVRTPDTAGSNPDTVFGFGTDALPTSGLQSAVGAGKADVGWRIKNGNLSATIMNGATTVSGTNTAVAASTTMLIVGNVTWGANSTSNATLKLYLPDASLNLGNAVSTVSAVLAVPQTDFDTISTGLKTNTGYKLDEIRFGATFEAVLPLAYWDLNGNTAGTGTATPAGTWNLTSAQWNSASDGSGTDTPTPWSPARTSAAVFSAGTDATGSYTITVDGTQDIGGLAFQEGTTTLSGGTALRMIKDTPMSVASGLTATLQTPISEDATPRALAKSGSGTLVLAGNNTHTGLTSSSAGVLTLSGNNSAMTGGVTVTSSRITVGHANALGSGTLTIGGTAPSLDNTSGTALTLATNNAQAWNADFSFVGSNSLNLGSGAVTLGGNRSVTVTAGTLTVGGPISGSFNLTKAGSGTLVLSGANAYSGTTTVSAGKLVINGDQTSAAGAVTVNANATLGGIGVLGGALNLAANGRLEFNLAGSPASHDKLELAASRILTFSGASVLTITSSGGASTGVYTLLTAPGGITGSAPATLNLPVGWSASVSISGNDLLLTVSSVGAADPYAAWSGGAAFDADANNDGIRNGIAWLLGAGSPGAQTVLPVSSASPGGLTLAFDCLGSANRGSSVLKLQYSRDLGLADPWPGHEVVVPGAVGLFNDPGGVVFNCTANGALIHVEATIPASAGNPGGKLFARLMATQ